MRIMNTPTADRNPIASGDTRRNRNKHIFKNLVKVCKVPILSQVIINKYLKRCKIYIMPDTIKTAPFISELMFNHFLKEQKSIWSSSEED